MTNPAAQPKPTFLYRPIVFVSFKSHLGDIPDVTENCLCGGSLQREFWNNDIITEEVVIRPDPRPVYGCQSCGIKTLDPATEKRFRAQAASQLRSQGFSKSAALVALESSRL